MSLDAALAGLGVLAAGSWTAALVAVRRATRPPAIREPAWTTVPVGPVPPDPWVPPAVVALVTHGWTVGEEAASATLVDLAARGHLRLAEVIPGRVTSLSIPSASTAEGVGAAGDRLLRFEELVLDRVRESVGGGAAPTGVIGLERGEGRRWWRAFRAAVAAEARERGVSRPRVSTRVKDVLFGAGFVAACAVAAWPGYVPLHAPDVEILLLVGLGLTVTSEVLIRRVLAGERETQAGVVLARWWLGRRGALSEAVPSPRRAGGDGVAVRAGPPDRRRAYAAALGVPGAVARDVVFRRPDRSRVWSGYGGTWRQVGVRYPRRAHHRITLTFLAGVAARVLAAGGLGYYVFVIAPTLPADDERARLAAQILALLPACWLTVSAVRVVRAAALDAGRERTVTGQVLWLGVAQRAPHDDDTAPGTDGQDPDGAGVDPDDSVHLAGSGTDAGADADADARVDPLWDGVGLGAVPVEPVQTYHVVVDDGVSARTTAWSLPAALRPAIRRGDIITITGTPWSHRVAGIDILVHGDTTASTNDAKAVDD